MDYFSLDVEGPELEILQTIPFDKVKIDVISVEYKISGHYETESGQRSLAKLEQVRTFFKSLGNYIEVGILPWGTGSKQDNESKGLDVIFKRVKWTWVVMDPGKRRLYVFYFIWNFLKIWEFLPLWVILDDF